jgi:methylmalonic aciduria homocystinuria type C protein
MLLDDLRARCETAGLDLFAPFDAATWNERAAKHERLPDVGREHALAVVVGNTRRLWPAFLAAHASRPDLRADANPLDRYVVDELTGAVSRTGARAAIAWGHLMQPAPVPIQRIAAAAGLAALGPAHLCVHPTFGPWIALRAVVVLDAPPPEAVELTRSPCDGCSAPCVPALARAVAAPAWRAWLAVRDACPVGGAHRYGDDQIAYHYTKDRGALTPAASGRSRPPRP